MSARITRTTAVAVLAAAAIAAPSAAANPVLPAGINAGLGPSSGLATSAAPNAGAELIDSTDPAGINAGLGPSSGLAAIASASAGHPAVAAATLPTGGFDWSDAGIGAAGMLSLLGLVAGSVVLIRRQGRGAGARSVLDQP